MALTFFSDAKYSQKLKSLLTPVLPIALKQDMLTIFEAPESCQAGQMRGFMVRAIETVHTFNRVLSTQNSLT